MGSFMDAPCSSVSQKRGGGIGSSEKLVAASLHDRLRSKGLLSDFLLGFFFDPEDGGNMFLRNIC
jgi:hypothetical protein